MKMSDEKYKQLVDQKIGRMNPYCTLDAKEYRSDNIKPGDHVEIHLGYMESVMREVLEVDLEARLLKVHTSINGPGVMWVPMYGKAKYNNHMFQHHLDMHMPQKFRIQMLENKLKLNAKERKTA